jgi:hypothetical protein
MRCVRPVFATTDKVTQTGTWEYTVFTNVIYLSASCLLRAGVCVPAKMLLIYITQVTHIWGQHFIAVLVRNFFFNEIQAFPVFTWSVYTGFEFDLNLRKKLMKCYIHVIWCWTVDTSESRSEIPGKFQNVVLEKDGEVHLDRLCEKWSITYSQGGEEYPIYNKKKEG